MASEALKKKQQQMDVNGRKLVKACVTCWNSSNEMFDRLLKLRWPVTAVLSDEEVTKRSEQWKLAEDLVKILQPFNIATTFLSYEENVSISSVFPILHGLIDQLKPSIDPADFTAIRQFKEKVSQEIKRRWELDSIDITSPLDPHFRQLTFTNLEEAISEDLKEKIIEYAEEQQKLQKEENDEAEVVEPPLKKKRTSSLDLILGPDQAASHTSSNSFCLKNHPFVKILHFCGGR